MLPPPLNFVIWFPCVLTFTSGGDSDTFPSHAHHAQCQLNYGHDMHEKEMYRGF